MFTKVSTALVIFIRLATLATCAFSIACSPVDRINQGTNESLPAKTYFPIHLKNHTIQLQLALTQSEQSKGLMNRDRLETNHGMLFIFKKPEKRSFWMKNTHIPLDIGYFDTNGQLVEIHKLYPFDETTVVSRSTSILMALEMNQNWFRENNVSPGASLDLLELKKAIQGRGFSPANFQLSTSE